MKNGQKILTACAAAAALLMAAPVLFLQNEFLSGICGISALLLFTVCVRLVENRKQFFVLLATLWLAQSLRFSTLFGTDLEFIALVFLMSALLAVFSGVFMALECLLSRKKHYALQLLIFPAAYTLQQITMVSLNLGDLTNQTVYLMLLPVFGRNLTWLGEYGLTFILCLILSLLAGFAVFKTPKGKRVSAAVAGVVLLNVLLVAGTMTGTKERPADYSLNVAVAVREKMGFTDTVSPLTEEEQFRIFQDSVEKAAENGADLLVFSEEFCDVNYAKRDEMFSAYAEIIRKNKIPTLIGVSINRNDGELSVNEAVFYDADGTVLCEYVKNNLVPFVETGLYVDGAETPGVLTCTLGGHEVDLAAVICFDVNDSAYLRKIPEDTELLIVPSWDWDSCNLEQRRMRIRSVERNTTMLCHCYEGFTFASGPYGLCGDLIDFRNEYETVKMIEVPIWEKE